MIRRSLFVSSVLLAACVEPSPDDDELGVGVQALDGDCSPNYTAAITSKQSSLGWTGCGLIANDGSGGRRRDCTQGRIVWHPTETEGCGIAVSGAIKTRYAGLGAPGGSAIGYPVGDTVRAGGGRLEQRFQRGILAYRGTGSARIVGGGTNRAHGALMNRFASDPDVYRYPVVDTAYSAADGGAFFYDSETNPYYDSTYVARVDASQAVRVQGEIQNYWVSIGRENSYLGWPTTDEIADGPGIYSSFTGGRVYWVAPSSRAVEGRILAAYLAAGAHNGALGLPITDAPSPASSTYPRTQYFEHGAITAVSPTTAYYSGVPTCSEATCVSPDHITGLTQASSVCFTEATPNPSTGFISTCQEWGATHDDADLDHLPDTLENQLIERFAPVVLADSVYDRDQAYGVGAWGGPHAAAVVRIVNGYDDDGRHIGPEGWNCGVAGAADGTAFEDRRCIELVFTLPYNYDLGDDLFGHSHPGDSEVTSVLVARTNPYSYAVAPSWSTSWEIARTDAIHWEPIRRWAAAHYGTGADSSSGTLDPSRRVYAALGKHATYFTLGQCEDGGFAQSDTCGETIAYTPVYRNAGEQYIHDETYFPGAIIARPSGSRYTRASGDYHLWTDGSFASSSPYAQVVRNRFMNWAWFTTFTGGRQPGNGEP